MIYQEIVMKVSNRSEQQCLPICSHRGRVEGKRSPILPMAVADSVWNTMVVSYIFLEHLLRSCGFLQQRSVGKADDC